jgi:hypothetical protein
MSVVNSLESLKGNQIGYVVLPDSKMGEMSGHQGGTIRLATMIGRKLEPDRRASETRELVQTLKRFSKSGGDDCWMLIPGPSVSSRRVTTAKAGNTRRENLGVPSFANDEAKYHE